MLKQYPLLHNPYVSQQSQRDGLISRIKFYFVTDYFYYYECLTQGEKLEY